MPIEDLSPHATHQSMAEPPRITHVIPSPPELVRCACEQCGAHTNAVWTFHVSGSCPTCGSFRLAPLNGAELMDSPRLVA